MFMPTGSLLLYALCRSLISLTGPVYQIINLRSYIRIVSDLPSFTLGNCQFCLVPSSTSLRPVQLAFI